MSADKSWDIATFDHPQQNSLSMDDTSINTKHTSRSIEANSGGNPDNTKDGTSDQGPESSMAPIGIETDAEKAESSKEPVYTTFTKSQKLAIVFMASLSSFFSPLSSSIYFPALNTMASYYHVTPSLINLTITMYQVFQGLSPAFYGDFADQAGRRPAFLTAFVVYLAANIGLAVQNSYAALMVLRCLQSSGSSGTVALSLGVIADVVVPAERGIYMGFAIASALLAMALGPIIGGLLSQFLGWRSTFWFLVIFSACFVSVYSAFMPETSRKIIGNGSIPPDRWWNKSLLDVLRGRKLRRSQTQETRDDRSSMPRKPVQWPRPWKSLQVMKEKDVAIVLILNAVATCEFYMILTTTPLQFKEIYGFNEIQIGLCYIPLGVGCFAVTVINGRLTDWNFRRIAKAHNVNINKYKTQDLRDFPIERARLQIFLPMYLLGLLTVLCYGWVLSQSPSLAAPLVLQFLMGGFLVASNNSGSTLLVDMYPNSPSMVSATNNMSRCLLGAGATALVQPMIDGMGLGWTFTLVACVGMAFTPLSLVLLKYGPGWREERRATIEKANKTENGAANN